MNLYGIAEIAEKTGARPQTVAQWYRRGHLPEPDAVLRMGPVWTAQTLNAARRTAGARMKEAHATYDRYLVIKPLNDQSFINHRMREMYELQKKIK